MNERERDRRRCSTAKLREEAAAVLDAMDPRGTTEQFTYCRRHFWVTKNFARGTQITACICAKCVALGPIT